MKRKILALLACMISLKAYAQVKFEFKYKKDDSYRILSTVEEDIFYNRVKSHHSVILNRVTAKVTDVTEDGSGIHDCTFMTSEDSVGARTGRTFKYGKEYKSIFTRSKLGKYTIGEEYFMPTVRDVPVFPDKMLLPGDKWTEKGHEAHDLKETFGMEKPYLVPFNAEYTYLGTDKKTGLHKINVKYVMFMQTPPNSRPSLEEYPDATQGFSDEIIWWDNEKGAIDHYTENFRILIETNLGNIFEFTGKAHAEITDFERVNTKENLESMKSMVEKMNLQNVTVLPSEKGLTISLEDIKFMPDSANLLQSEIEKIKSIARILKSYPENDILVSGHTALAGSEGMRKILSEERAATVAEYLISLGVRDKYHIFTQGFGAEKPAASNDTEEGRAKNRRVEITILDN